MYMIWMGVCIGVAVYNRHLYVYMLLHIEQQLSGALGDYVFAVRHWQWCSCCTSIEAAPCSGAIAAIHCLAAS